MAAVLEGVRVADFGRYIAGPYCASLLGDLGAEVIRVEAVGGGVDREVVPLAGEKAGGATFLGCNRNKKSLAIDMASAEGKEVIRRLVASSEIVVANLPGPSLLSMGLDYESLKAVRPDIILTTINAFGAGGPVSSASPCAPATTSTSILASRGATRWFSATCTTSPPRPVSTFRILPGTRCCRRPASETAQNIDKGPMVVAEPEALAPEGERQGSHEQARGPQGVPRGLGHHTSRVGGCRFAAEKLRKFDRPAWRR